LNDVASDTCVSLIIGQRSGAVAHPGRNLTRFNLVPLKSAGIDSELVQRPLIAEKAWKVGAYPRPLLSST